MYVCASTAWCARTDPPIETETMYTHFVCMYLPVPRLLVYFSTRVVGSAFDYVRACAVRVCACIRMCAWVRELRYSANRDDVGCPVMTISFRWVYCTAAVPAGN